MSSESAKEFMAYVKNHKESASKVKTMKTPHEVCLYAKSLGFLFTEEELEAAAKKDGVLDDDDIDEIVGGTFWIYRHRDASGGPVSLDCQNCFIDFVG